MALLLLKNFYLKEDVNVCYIEKYLLDILKYEIFNFKFMKSLRVDINIVANYDTCMVIKLCEGDKYVNYIKNLMERGDLTGFYRSHSKSKMLCSRSTPKIYNEERIIAYAKPIIELARSLYSGTIYFSKKYGLKVNYYSLNPYDISRTILDIANIDSVDETIHLDISPRYEAFHGNDILILTFCIIRGINDYDETMGKHLYFPKIDGINDFCVIPQDDRCPDLEITIFLSDVVYHGSTTWNLNNPTVKTQMNDLKQGIIHNNPNLPGRMSITMPIYFITSNPLQLWENIKQKFTH